MDKGIFTQIKNNFNLLLKDKKNYNSIEKELKLSLGALKQKFKRHKSILSFIESLNRLNISDKDYFTEFLDNIVNISETVLNISIDALKGIGASRTRILKQKNISTILDLIYYMPRTYSDRRFINRIGDLIKSDQANIMGQVISCEEKRGFRGRGWFEAYVKDDTGIIKIVFWNQNYLKKLIKQNMLLFLSGRVDYYNGLVLNNPEFFILTDDNKGQDYKGIIPIYSLPPSFTQRSFRNIINSVLKEFSEYLIDILPPKFRKKYDLIHIQDAALKLHFPENISDIERAKKRLIFEELFSFQILMGYYKSNSYLINKGRDYKCKNELVTKLKKILSFELTDAQVRAINKIYQLLLHASPMNALLHGDVGCGKTIAAYITLLPAIENNYQAAFMAPTEILATQHYKKLKEFNEKLNIRPGLLIGSLSEKEKREIHRKIKDKEIDLIFGTHALISDNVVFENLAYAIVDEQHKFGVMQRNALRKKGYNIDVLIMSATPIPRTLGLTMYADLDIVTIDEMPAKRGKIVTKVLRDRKENRKKVYEFVKDEIKKGRQCYIIYPLIEESEKLDIKAAAKYYEKLKKTEFKEFKTALVHSRIEKTEREKIMKDFYKNEINILISTTVIEVGVDVANASIMIIENSERFGLSQLHQLRGRIGRGVYDSHCICFYKETSSLDTKERLKVFESTLDGFKIAEADLKFRGMGAISGTRQHGYVDFKFANPLKHSKILNSTRALSNEILKQDSNLEKIEHYTIKREVLKNKHIWDILKTG